MSTNATGGPCRTSVQSSYVPQLAIEEQTAPLYFMSMSLVDPSSLRFSMSRHVSPRSLAADYRLKRFFDLCVAVPAFVLAAPLMLLTAVLVALFLGRPVVFRQQRPGLNAKLFTIFKFRTMTNETGPDGDLLPDVERLTPFGRFLRSSSLDELPELINVFRGEMSVVGPRPLLARYLGRYSSFQMRRHEAHPGITGWAQVNGRNALNWDQKLAMDVWYVDHQSLWLDIRIVALTIRGILRRHGIDEPGEVGSSEFLGEG